MFPSGVVGRFQFTLPHGERRQGVRGSYPSIVFQFTLPHGERPGLAVDGLDAVAVSIHAPAWGATVVLACNRFPTWGFNSRSRMGSDIGDVVENPF